MKYIQKFLLFAAVAALMTACETYGDPEVETTAVAPLDGRWICLAYDADEYAANPETAEPVEYVEIWTSNTAENASDKLWVNIARPCYYAHARIVYAYSVKADCDVKNKTISATNASTVEASPYFITTCYYYGAYDGYFYGAECQSYADMSVNIDSQVTVKGIETASSSVDKKYYTDKMVMNVEIPEDGINWTIVGARWTGWNQDHQKEVDWLNEFFGY